MTTLIIARHGNTFGPGDTVTYIGARTDLKLVESGRAQAAAIGKYLKDHRLIPDIVYASALLRAQETAKIAIRESGVTNPVYTLDIFNEIDYGPDENKTKDEVIARIGEQALTDWEDNNTVPPGWKADAASIIQNWMDFAAHISGSSSSRRKPGSSDLLDEDPVFQRDDDDYKETALVFTSNGIARFAPHITGDYGAFKKQYGSAKLATGALGILEYNSGWTVKGWTVKGWNIKP